jgi:hypothetical protein
MRISVILLLAVVLVALLYLFTRGPAKMDGDGQPDYVQLSEKYFTLLFAPLDSASSNPIHDLAAFAGTCRQRAARNGPDAEVAQLSFRLCARLMTVSRIRETLAAELRQYETAPPSALNRNPDEQKRRQEFHVNQTLRQKWQPAVQEYRPGCEELLRQIRQLQARRRTLWTVLKEWLAPLARAVGKAQDWLFGDSSARTPPAPSGGTILCGHCQGTGVVTCPECGGFGKVDSGEKETCPQCGGTGRYQKRMTAGTLPCTFCRGTGHTAVSKRVLCKTCEGKGQIQCPECGGRGKTGR